MLQDTLPEQESEFRLASFGFGSRLQLMDHLNGSLDMGLPLIGQFTTRVHSPLFTFRVWADF
jgi:hemolysin activation/secretion protein